MAKLSTEEFEAAEARGEALLRGPVAVGAHYDEGRDRVVIHLSTGVELGLRPKNVEGLEKASPAELKVIEIEAAGLGIRFPTIDADLYIPALDGTGAWGGGRWGTKPKESRNRTRERAKRRPAARGCLLSIRMAGVHQL